LLKEPDQERDARAVWARFLRLVPGCAWDTAVRQQELDVLTGAGMLNHVVIMHEERSTCTECMRTKKVSNDVEDDRGQRRDEDEEARSKSTSCSLILTLPCWYSLTWMTALCGYLAPSPCGHAPRKRAIKWLVYVGTSWGLTGVCGGEKGRALTKWWAGVGGTEARVFDLEPGDHQGRTTGPLRARKLFRNRSNVPLFFSLFSPSNSSVENRARAAR